MLKKNKTINLIYNFSKEEKKIFNKIKIIMKEKKNSKFQKLAFDFNRVEFCIIIKGD